MTTLMGAAWWCDPGDQQGGGTQTTKSITYPHEGSVIVSVISLCVDLSDFITYIKLFCIYLRQTIVNKNVM